MLPEKPNIKIGITHGGICHADDAFSTALLKILYPNIRIMRVSEVPDSLKDNPTVIVYDIGGGRYDHHYGELETRSNGVPYSSFGKLWRDFGKYILPEDISWKYIDTVLVQPIDKHDNGLEQNLLSGSFRWINMSWEDEDRSNTENFNNAVQMASIILNGLIHRKKSEEAADKIVKNALDRNPGHILILDKYIPIPPDIREDVLYYIYPNERNGYNVSVIVDRTKRPRRELPKEWYSSKPEGLKFIHKNNKFVNFDTMEHAIDATNQAISKEYYIKKSVMDVLLDDGFKIYTSDNHEVDIKSVAVMQNNHACILEYDKEDITAINLNPLIIDKDDNDKLKINANISYGMVYKHNWTSDPNNAGMKYDITVYNENAKNKVIYILYKGGNKLLV